MELRENLTIRNRNSQSITILIGFPLTYFQLIKAGGWERREGEGEDDDDENEEGGRGRW